MQKHDSSFFRFINDNLNSDPIKLRLKYAGKHDDFPYDFAVIQIESRKKYREKLKKFISEPGVLFPDSLAGEQASHEAIAKFHASLIEKSSFLLDMTGGLGIDSLEFSNVCDKVITIEKDKNKAETLTHNLKIKKIANIEVINGDSIDYLRDSQLMFDVIFIDPARRDASLRRVYAITDCEPDVGKFLNDILEKTGKLMIKASPLLDITQTVKDFPELTSIRAVGVKGECKEILLEFDKKEASRLGSQGKENSGNILCEAIDLDNEGNVISRFEEYLSEVEKEEINLAGPEDLTETSFLYEPSAMLMKLKPWYSLIKKFPGLKKFAGSSHLFVSNTFYEGFPGRITKIEKIITKQDRKTLKGFPANIVSRNYPETAEEIRKTLKVKEGSDKFIYASRLGNKPVMLLTSLLEPLKTESCR